MSKDTLYSQEDIDRLSKYGNVVDKIVDKLSEIVEDDLKGKDARKVRVLIETIQAGTDSIHKAASNRAKAEANNNDKDIKILIAQSIQELNATKIRHADNTDEDREKMFDQIKRPDDVVSGEDKVSVGYLSLSDLERPKD